MMSPEEYLKSNSIQECVLYYPGAGTDIQPLKLFAQHPQVTRVIYADYLTGESRRHDVREFIVHLGPVAEPEGLAPAEFFCNGWTDFWSDTQNHQPHTNPDHAFGLRCFLRNPFGRRPIRFDYLATEGIGTYSVLVKAGIRPSIVVLQEHSGNAKTWFGSGCELHSMALECDALPEMLLVASNTDPWPGYERVSDDAAGCGEANHNRALYRRTRSPRAQKAQTEFRN
jgi:hypothetical protein